MRTYDRANEAHLLRQADDKGHLQLYWWDYWDDYDDHHDCTYCNCSGITMESVRQGFLLNLLVKLNVKSAQEPLSHLNW